jgi:large subunit ribosomal protein L17
MRKRKKQTKLSRSSSHQRALLSNLSQELIKHGKIKTTLSKAKALRPFVEPIITKAKTGGDYMRKLVSSVLYDRSTVTLLFEQIGPRYVSEARAGGYTRITKLGRRNGDGAEEALIELVVTAEPVKEPNKKESKKSDNKK